MENFEKKGHIIVLYQCQKGQGKKRKLEDCPLR